MTPTPKLRFVERPFSYGTMVCIPQQWWEPERNIIDIVAGKTQGEWRDVPLEVEALPQPEHSIAGYCKKIEELIAERDSLRTALAQPEHPPQRTELEPGRNHYEDGDVFERIAARQKAKQPARRTEQEPSVTVTVEDGVWISTRAANFKDLPDGQYDLYTTPPQRTDALMQEIRNYLVAAADGSMSPNNSEQLASELLQKIDAHGIKEEA